MTTVAAKDMEVTVSFDNILVSEKLTSYKIQPQSIQLNLEQAKRHY